jgi:hypothetical protein
MWWWKRRPQSTPPTHQVAYTVTVTPGEQYRLHQVSWRTTSIPLPAPTSIADFDEGGRTLQPRVRLRLPEEQHRAAGTGRYSASYKAYADPNTHTVDLVLTFFRGAGLASPR